MIPDRTEQDCLDHATGKYDDEARLGAVPFVIQSRELLLDSEGLTVDDKTSKALLEQMTDLYWQF